MEAAWVPKESRKMLLGCVDCVASQVHGYLKAHQTEHSTCTRPHMIILQQGHVMLKGERGEREGESRGGRAKERHQQGGHPDGGVVLCHTGC